MSTAEPKRMDPECIVCRNRKRTTCEFASVYDAGPCALFEPRKVEAKANRRKMAKR